ncbi:MAG: hypothetical protein IJY18_03725, partial [Clostridia bacterium]|nr:hypothetical protein [Clostridia bacterium]
MKKLTKVLILLLSVALICTGFVFAVSANQGSASANVAKIEGVREYATLAAAIDAVHDGEAPAGSTIKLIADTSLETGLAIGEDMTIDLNGYTLTGTTDSTSYMFKVVTANTTFEIVGDGVINVDCRLIDSAIDTKTDGIVVNIKGATKGIIVNHTGSILVYANYGSWNYENVVFNLSGSGIAFNSSAYITPENAPYREDNFTGSLLFLNFKGCEIYAPSAGADIPVFYVSTHAKFNMDYCTVETSGDILNLQYQYYYDGTYTTKDDGTISYTGKSFTSHIGDTVYISNSVLKANSSLSPESSYAALSGNIVFDNTYVGYKARCNLKHNYAGSSLVFKNNSVLEVLANVTAFRSISAVFESGSSIRSTANMYTTSNGVKSYTQLYGTTNNDNASKKGITLKAGSRVNNKIYDLIANGLKTNWSNYNPYTFEDGEYWTNTTNYKFVFDAAGNPEAPYLVVEASDAASFTNEFFANGDDLYGDCLMQGNYAYYDSALWPKTIFNPTDGKITPVVTDSTNRAVKLERTGKTAEKINPAYIIGFDQPVPEKLIDVIVIDFDFGSGKSGSNIVAGGMYIHSRSSATSPSSGNTGTQKKVFGISSGNVTLPTDSDTTVTISKTNWNHCTVVVDTTVSGGLAYVYVNGDLIDKAPAYSADGACIYGIRYDITSGSAGHLLMDNVLIRTYGDGSATTALTEETADDYTTDSGKTFNWSKDASTGTVTAGSITNSSFSYDRPNNAEFSVGGVPVTLDKISEVVDEKTTLKYVAHVSKSGTYGPITLNGVIATDGNKLNFATDSNSFINLYDNDGNVIGMKFDDQYKDLELSAKWFKGNPKSATQLADESLWETVTLKSGIIPSLSRTITPMTNIVSRVDGQDYYFVNFDGSWTIKEEDLLLEDADHIGADIVMKYEGQTVSIVPNYSGTEKANVYTFIVLDKSGEFRIGSTLYEHIASSRWNTHATQGVRFSDGETVVMLADLMVAGNISPISDSAKNEVFSFDLNGYDLTTNYSRNETACSPNPFAVKNGDTWNIYSSVDGASIVLAGWYNQQNSSDREVIAATKIDQYTYGGELIVLGSTQPGDETRAEKVIENAAGNTDNTKVNLGMGKGSITINCDVLVRACDGDTSCEINIDGINVVRNTYYNGHTIGDVKKEAELFNVTAYSGKINVKNSNLVLAAGGNLVQSAQWLSRAKDDNGDYTNTTSICDMVFDNCNIITQTNEQKLVRNNYGISSMTFKNCVTNGTVNNPSNMSHKVYVENTAAANLDTTSSEGFQTVNYYAPMTLEGLTTAETFKATYKYYDSTLETPAIVTVDLVIAANGYAGEADLVLPVLPEKSVADEDVLTVTYAGLGNNAALLTEKYAKGGYVQDKTATLTDVPAYDGAALTLTHDATWGEVPTAALTESVTINPGYTVAVKVQDLETNLSIYSDFGVNLYIPAEYAEYVEVKYGETALEETAVVIDEKNYVRVTVRRNVKDITEGVKFDITVTEEGASVAKSATVNIVTYATDILAGDSYTEADKYLMYYMLAYAKEAVKYLNSAEAYDETLAAATETYKA